MVEIVNRQRQTKLSAKHWREFGELALQALDKDEENATIVFVSDSAIKVLNRRFRGKNQSTDVLSFKNAEEPFEIGHATQLGEVIISVPRAAAQAKENGLSFADEIRQLILHGLLHLCGYDHETDHGEMNRQELRLRKRLGI
jgi:probable rRNA maturation factor